MLSYVFPGNIDTCIAKIGAEPIPYMRTDEFSTINLESERILLDLIHCKDGKQSYIRDPEQEPWLQLSRITSARSKKPLS